MGLIKTIVSLADRYEKWYDENRLPAKEAGNFPKCMFCRARNYHIGPQTLANSRVMESRVRAIVTCRECGMRYQASRLPSSRRWYFNVST